MRHFVTGIVYYSIIAASAVGAWMLFGRDDE